MSDTVKNIWIDLISRAGIPAFILIMFLFGTYKLGALFIVRVLEPAAMEWVEVNRALAAADIAAREVQSGATQEMAESLRDMADAIQSIQKDHP